MNESKRSYTVDVWIDAPIYRAFSVFDAIRKERKWIRPLGFAVIFSIFAALCFIKADGENQAALLGAVLLLVGLGLPLSYFGSYFSTLKKRVEKLKIKEKKRHAYSVTLSDGADGVRAQTPQGEETVYPWAGIYKAYRLPTAVYLYVEAGKAYILPREQAGDDFDGLWELICACLPPEKRKVFG